MAYFLTEIALQLKGTLAFLLGLSGMFTIAKGLMVGLLVLPKIASDRPSIEQDAKKMRKSMIGCALASLVLFVVAATLYFSSVMASIDPEALKKSHCLLTIPQQWVTGGVAVIAVILVLIESYVAVLKYRFDLLSKLK